MVVGIGRFLVAAVVMLILLANVPPAACEVPSLLRPISSAGKMVATTTKKAAKASVATVKAIAAAPKNVLTKVGSTLTGKKK